MMEQLRELSLCRGISGDEDEIAALIGRLAAPYAARVERDSVGNLCVYKKGKSSEKKLLVAAHMDEVGLLVSYITPEGLLRFQPVGGIDPRVILGRRVLVGPTGIPGVIGTKPIHLSTEEERRTAPGVERLYMDIGAMREEEARRYVCEGDTASFDSDFMLFGDGMIKGKALDNRVGCAAALAALQCTPAFDTVFAFTVEEEVGLRGAYAVAYRERPDFAIVVDTTTAADVDGIAPHEQACRLGEGAVLFFMENSTLYRKEDYRWVEQTAQKKRYFLSV